MSGREKTVRPGGLLALRGAVGPVTARPRSSGRGAIAFTETEFNLNQVKVITVQADGSPALAKEGDELALVGQVKEGWVEPIAWWNLTADAGYSPRTWEFWPCVAGAGVLLGLLGVRLGLGTLAALDLLRTSVPLLLLGVLAWSAHGRRKAVQAVEAMRAGKSPAL